MQVLTLQLFSSSAFTIMVPHFFPGIPLWTTPTTKQLQVSEGSTLTLVTSFRWHYCLSASLLKSRGGVLWKHLRYPDRYFCLDIGCLVCTLYQSMETSSLKATSSINLKHGGTDSISVRLKLVLLDAIFENLFLKRSTLRPKRQIYVTKNCHDVAPPTCRSSHHHLTCSPESLRTAPVVSPC